MGNGANLTVGGTGRDDVDAVSNASCREKGGRVVSDWAFGLGEAELHGEESRLIVVAPFVLRWRMAIWLLVFDLRFLRMGRLWWARKSNDRHRYNIYKGD